MERYKLGQYEQQRQRAEERQVSSERALRRELEQMTPREVEKFREWCDRNAVPVVVLV